MVLSFLFACSSGDNTSTTTSVTETVSSNTETVAEPADSSTTDTQEIKVAAKDGFDNTRWKSKDDPKSVIEVKGGKWNDIYDGEALSSGDYKVENKTDGKFLTVTDGAEVYEYYIIKHTDTVLEMSMVGGRGNTLSFTKE